MTVLLWVIWLPDPTLATRDCTGYAVGHPAGELLGIPLTSFPGLYHLQFLQFCVMGQTVTRVWPTTLLGVRKYGSIYDLRLVVS